MAVCIISNLFLYFILARCGKTNSVVDYRKSLLFASRSVYHCDFVWCQFLCC